MGELERPRIVLVVGKPVQWEFVLRSGQTPAQIELMQSTIVMRQISETFDPADTKLDVDNIHVQSLAPHQVRLNPVATAKLLTQAELTAVKGVGTVDAKPTGRSTSSG